MSLTRIDHAASMAGRMPTTVVKPEEVKVVSVSVGTVTNGSPPGPSSANASASTTVEDSMTPRTPALVARRVKAAKSSAVAVGTADPASEST